MGISNEILFVIKENNLKQDHWLLQQFTPFIRMAKITSNLTLERIKPHVSSHYSSNF